MDILLCRHAESVWNAEGRWQGQSDVPLSERGRAEAELVGARLRAARFDRRVCSDLSRTRDTARAIGGAFEPDPAWREMDLGAWGGLLHAEVRERFPDDLEAFAEGRDTRGHGGETFSELEARASAALERVIATSAPSDRVLVVTHGGVVRALLTRLLGLHGVRRPLVGVANTSLTLLRVDPADRRVRLAGYNCAAHLGIDPHADWEATDEHVEHHEAVARAVAHLGLAPTIAPALHPPAPGTRTRLVPAPRAALRTFATPIAP